jgi:hypothetical protein
MLAAETNMNTRILKQANLILAAYCVEQLGKISF